MRFLFVVAALGSAFFCYLNARDWVADGDPLNLFFTLIQATGFVAFTYLVIHSDRI